MPDGMSPIDADHVAGRIGKLLAERRPGAVKALLAALAKLAPDYKDMALLQAAYWCQVQDPGQALAVMSVAITKHPAKAELWLRRADIHFAQGHFEDAAQNAAQAVLLAPNFGAAKSRLGLALMQLGQYDQAAACLAESFANEPANADVALALAALTPSTAIDILKRAIAANPRLALLQNALTRRYLCSGDIAQAMQIAGDARHNGIADAQTHCLLAFAQMEAADWDDAEISAARAQSIAPESRWAARLLAALSGRATGNLPNAMPEDAVIAEQALISGGTIVPGAFRTLIEESKITGPVLDLFCGTGLNAIAALGLNTGAWTGVDPDANCIARCAENNVYAALEQSDPLRALYARPEPAIILLNEALAYQASPQPWLAAIRVALGAGGIALAAIPTGRPGLNGHGLFAHSEAGIAQHAGANGLSYEASRIGILRYLEGLPVHGIIATFRAV